MGRAGTGAKAGAVAGVLTGLINGGVAYTTLLLFKEEFIEFFKELAGQIPPQAGLTAESLYAMSLTAVVAGAFITSIVMGLVVGALAGWKWEHIPGSGLRRGVVVGLALFMVGVAYRALSLTAAPPTPRPLQTINEPWSTLTTLLVDLLWGVLMASLYERWSVPKEPVSLRGPQTPTL